MRSFHLGHHQSNEHHQKIFKRRRQLQWSLAQDSFLLIQVTEAISFIHGNQIYHILNHSVWLQLHETQCKCMLQRHRYLSQAHYCSVPSTKRLFILRITHIKFTELVDHNQSQSTLIRFNMPLDHCLRQMKVVQYRKSYALHHDNQKPSNPSL